MMTDSSVDSSPMVPKQSSSTASEKKTGPFLSVSAIRYYSQSLRKASAVGQVMGFACPSPTASNRKGQREHRDHAFRVTYSRSYRACRRSGPRNLDSGLSEISIVFQAAVPKPEVDPDFRTGC